MIITFDGHTPKIAETAWVSQAAYVIGNVEIGEYSSVWPGAVIRGDYCKIVIGANTNIQDNCVIHGDAGDEVFIGDNVTVGHLAMIHGHRVGNSCLVGINSTILAKAEVGDFCIVGSHALVGERKKIPPRSLVLGVPGEIARELTEEQVKRLNHGGEHYVKAAQEFKKLGL
ncbi:MAG: gamma carbonic anhydrase family protein [Candidatus Tectomicrobia bacterium]|nr:gamma carbonic anhydrase family protein [Candidatus Tectomicrobia bacterium]